MSCLPASAAVVFSIVHGKWYMVLHLHGCLSLHRCAVVHKLLALIVDVILDGIYGTGWQD